MNQHIHKYRRVNIGRDTEYWVMKCQLPHCTHYTPMNTRVSCPQLVGKVALCSKCEDRFLLDRRSLQQAKPTCKGCVVSPKQKKIDAAAKMLENLITPDPKPLEE